MSNPTMMDDRSLVLKVLNGDRQAFRLLINQHERLVVHMIGRVVKSQEEREELCQDVFLRVYDKLGEFSFQSRLSTWIATIAYRYAINYAKKKKMVWSDLPDDSTISSRMVVETTPEEIVSDSDAEEFVLKMIELLPVQYKMVLTLYHVESMTYQEITDITGMPEGTVKNYLFRARHILKEKVKKYFSKEELI